MDADKYALLGTLKNSGLDLVAYVVERDFKNAMKHVMKDDLVGYGVFGLLRAARVYDPAKGVSFPTFACKKVKQAILGFIRQKCQQQYSGGDVHPVFMAGVCDRTYEECDAEDERAYVRSAVDALPEANRDFVDKYYLQELSVEKTLKATGLKRHRLFQLRTQSLALLRIQLWDCAEAHGRASVQRKYG